jgi:DNA-binding SARP family transcriptional activator
VIEATPAYELSALLHGAATLSRSGNRIAAIATLLSAVAVAPDDRTAHRRLAAAYAIAGDRASASAEYDRFVGRLEADRRADAAAAERAYAAALLVTAPPRAVIAAPVSHRLTADQSVALRRVGVAALSLIAALAVLLAAGAQIFASGI